MNPDQNPQPPTNPQSPTEPITLKSANPLAAMQPGEQIIAEIHRHPIGLVGVYLMSAIILVLAGVGAVLLPGTVESSMQHQVAIWCGAGFVFVAFFVFLGAYISAHVYKGNRWIITSDSLTQVSQHSLFGKQSSQLSLHNLEDVTVHQNGLIQSTFNYGTLKAETAGEHSKFTFPFCPDPNGRARDILMAREKFMGEGGFTGGKSGINVNTR